MKMEKLRIGIAGAGGITRSVLQDLANGKMVQVEAIASRSLGKAKDYASRFGIARYYDSYEQLASDPNLDLIYIGTTNPYHREIALLMLQHDKHVLCEKPMGINASETEEMIEAAQQNNAFLMEAMWNRFLPCYRQALDMIRGGELGEIRHVDVNFSFMAAYDPSHRLFDPMNGGGAMLDVGVYTLAACTEVYQMEPEYMHALVRKTPDHVDQAMAIQLQYPTGATAHSYIGMDARSDDGMKVYGTMGCLEMKGFWHPTGFMAAIKGRPVVAYTFDRSQVSYHYEFDHAAKCIQQGLKESPVMPLSDTLCISRVSTALRNQAGVHYPFEKES